MLSLRSAGRAGEVLGQLGIGAVVGLGLTQAETARQLGNSVNRLNELVLGKRGITADTALRLARRFHTTPQLWMHLQADWFITDSVVYTDSAQRVGQP